MKGKLEQKAARGHFVVILNLGNSSAHPQGWETTPWSPALMRFPEWHTVSAGVPGQPLSIAGNWEGQLSLSLVIPSQTYIRYSHCHIRSWRSREGGRPIDE